MPTIEDHIQNAKSYVHDILNSYLVHETAEGAVIYNTALKADQELIQAMRCLQQPSDLRVLTDEVAQRVLQEIKRPHPVVPAIAWTEDMIEALYTVPISWHVVSDKYDNIKSSEMVLDEDFIYQGELIAPRFTPLDQLPHKHALLLEKGLDESDDDAWGDDWDQEDEDQAPPDNGGYDTRSYLRHIEGN